MKQPTCPSCQALITQDNINLKEGVALCPACGKLSRLSEITGTDMMSRLSLAMAMAGQQYETVDLSHQWQRLPSGCHVKGWPGDVTLTASARSIANGLFLCFFAVFWNSIVSVFVAVMLAGLYVNLVGPLPAFLSGLPDDMPLGISLFLVLFLTPFVLVGAVVAGTALTSLFGSVRLEVHGDDARASTGIGPFRWSKRFKVLEVTDVKVGIQTGKNSQRHIAIEGVKTVKFGSLLSEERMYWMASSAVVLLLTPDSPEVSQLIALGGGQNGVQL